MPTPNFNLQDIKKINHDLDKFDELISQIYEQKSLLDMEGKLG